MIKNSQYLLCLGVVFYLIICGCSSAPLSTQYRKIGAEYHERWFKALPETPNLYEVVRIDKVTIHIVSDRKDFTWEKARGRETGIAAYATTNNEIDILGKKIGNRTVVNQFILGHEFKHILNFNDPEIVDPHDRATMEYCIGKKLEALCK